MRWLLVFALVVQAAFGCAVAPPPGLSARIAGEDVLILWDAEHKTEHLIGRAGGAVESLADSLLRSVGLPPRGGRSALWPGSFGRGSGAPGLGSAHDPGLCRARSARAVRRLARSSLEVAVVVY